MPPIHVAITRRVKPGKEEEFATALRKFAHDSLCVPGMTGVHLIEPIIGSEASEFGILRSFESEAASRAFYDTELFKNWLREVEPLVIGDSILRRLHGLEAFFREAGTSPPPRWKMAVVTFLGVFPAVFVWSTLMGWLLEGVHRLAVMAVVNVLVVITLTWLVMPFLTRFFAGWLRHGSRPPTG